MCACEREEGHPLDTHSFYHLTHSDSCCWGKRRNGSNTTPPNGASHSKQPQFNRERNISFLPFNSACSSRAKRDPDRGSSRMPFLIFLILAITETVITREKRTPVLGACDSSVAMLQLMILFSCTHTVGSQTRQHVSWEQKYSCAYYESYFLDQKHAPKS